MVIAVSERIGKITIYYGSSKYVLQSAEELLRRATETMQILEKQREVFDELLMNLNVLEVTSLVSIADICSIRVPGLRLHPGRNASWRPTDHPAN